MLRRHWTLELSQVKLAALFMVPVICALVSADVNAGTASAARIAIIAITTSNSMRVNAEEDLFILIFMWVFYFFLLGSALRLKATADRCSEGFSEGFVLGFFVLFWVWGLFRGFLL